MNEGKIAAPQEVVEEVSSENFNLVWAYVDWTLNVGRFNLSSEAMDEFRQIPQEFRTDGSSLELLNSWMAHHLKSVVRRRIFSDIRRAQFEAAKGAVQIIIAEETRELLRQRKTALFGKDRGSMEVTIRHLLGAEMRSLPLQAFRLLESFRQRNSLATLSDTVKALVDHVELTSMVDGAKPLRGEIVQILSDLKKGK